MLACSGVAAGRRPEAERGSTAGAVATQLTAFTSPDGAAVGVDEGIEGLAGELEIGE